MKEIAIKVENVSKDFRLPHEKATTLKSAFTNIFRGKRGRTYERQHALKNISFEVKKGEFFGIVGRNGSGKSTLLKLLAGIYQPTKGSLQAHGKLVPFIELGVGFNPELTGRENVYLNGALLGFGKKQVQAMYDEIVEFAELEKFMDQKLKNYSSGMQVRLAFSMAIRAKADILLVDEVLAVGDADFQRKCFDYFKSLKKNKQTVVFVTHDMDAVREYCDRAILIDASNLVDEGDAQTIASKYTRLFTANQPQELDEEQKRWGNQQVKILNPKAEVLTNTKKIVVSATLEAREIVKEPPIFGFVVKSPGGSSILGTNTKIKQKNLPSLKKGQKVDCSFELDNIFNEGSHSVDLAVIDNDTITVCDWWEVAVSFRIVKERPSPHLVDPEIKISINT